MPPCSLCAAAVAAIDVSGGYFYTPRHAPPGAPAHATADGAASPVAPATHLASSAATPRWLRDAADGCCSNAAAAEAAAEARTPEWLRRATDAITK